MGPERTSRKRTTVNADDLVVQTSSAQFDVLLSYLMASEVQGGLLDLL